MTSFLLLFMTLLYMAFALSILFLVIIAYCVCLEWAWIDPDSTTAFMIGVFAVIFPGMFLISYLFVTKCIPLMDWIIYPMGLTGG